MVDFKIKAFLWYQDPKAGVRGSDKIWGWVEVGDNLYNFWGRRADSEDQKKHLTFKLNDGKWGNYELTDKTRQKRAKGYREIPCTRHGDGEYPDIEKVYPNFVASFQRQLMFAKLSDNVRGTGRFHTTA
jgi:hypothetical protein